MKKKMKKRKKRKQSIQLKHKKKFNTHIAEASAEHDLLMNSYLQTNKNNHSHSDSLCLATPKIDTNSRN